MPFAPVIRTGTLPAYDLDESLESGLLTESVKFTPIIEFRKKNANASATAINQTVQTRTLNQGLSIDVKGSIIPNVSGVVEGLAAGYVGQTITLVHFASGGVTRHGYTRDDLSSLVVTEISTDLGNTAPADVSFKAEYLPYCIL